MQWFLKRLAEPSSYAGMAAVITAASGLAQGGVTPEGMAAMLTGLAAFLIGEARHGQG